jgi:urease accessory protein
MIAKLHIQTFLRNGITQLGNCYFSPPLKVMNITEDKLAKELHLMLMSSSPGILDEDEYDIKIELEADTALQLLTQSYQRLFNMQKGAWQKLEAHLKKGASFTFLPHPTAPHEKAIFTSINKIYLQENCTLLWGEVLTCGRKLNDEVFQFSKYHNIVEIFYHEKLVIKENLLMQPLLVNPILMGQMEGYTHQANLIYWHEACNMEELNQQLYDFLSKQTNIEFGISATPINGLIIRILGYKAEQLYGCIKDMACQLKKLTFIENAI